MMKRVKFLDALFYILIIGVILAYICGIFLVNVGSRAYLDYDMYSDAVVARYMAEGKTLFPEGWHFGNQIYVVATPAVAACLYPVFQDSYSALAAASCLMTILTVVSFLWCVRPLSGGRSIAIGLMVLIGGINIGWTAHKDLMGLQLFYTVASYYACYVIGIFVTLGIYNRKLLGLGVKKGTVLIAAMLNIALGMQSLREMLVLNLPLCAIVVLQFFRSRCNWKQFGTNAKKAGCFAAIMLLASVAGLVINKLLIASGAYVQARILQDVQWNLRENVLLAVSAFAEYIGLAIPNDLFTFFRFATALVSIVIAAVALTFAAVEFFGKKASVMTCNILFFAVSLLAIFFAGVFVLELRPVYYFCWYLFLAFCVVYLLEMDWSRCKVLLVWLKKLLVIALLGISIVNYNYLFRYSYLELKDAAIFYQNIADQLRADGIEYLYTDSRSEQPMIATMSRDQVKYAILSFSRDTQDLWNQFPYLYMEDWLEEANPENSYILLTSETLQILEQNHSPEYVAAFMENLQLVHTFTGNKTTVWLYRGTQKMYAGINN